MHDKAISEYYEHSMVHPSTKLTWKIGGKTYVDTP